MLLAWLKLRKRNLGPILDANGWAVNARARINVPFGASLTGIAVLPPGALRDKFDPFAEKKRPWGLYIFLFILLLLAGLWAFGKLDAWLPDSITSHSVLHRKPALENSAPVSPAPANPAVPNPAPTKPPA
jgi:hypothetical protein